MTNATQIPCYTTFADIFREHERKRLKIDNFKKLHSFSAAVKECSKLADGKHLVIYSPGRDEMNEHGCVVEEVIMALCRNDEVRFVIKDKLVPGGHYVIRSSPQGPLACFEGFLSDKTVKPGLKAPEGTEFRGWKKTKQYRLTQSEIDALIMGKVFEQG